MDIDKIINIVRNLREEAMVAPTNNVGSGKIAGTKEAVIIHLLERKKRDIFTEDEVPEECGCRKMDDNNNVNAAILERLEKVVQSLQENSVKMGELLAVHNEKLDKQDRIDAVLFEKIEQVDQKLDRHATDIKKGCERDIMLVDNRLRTIEKKMWTIAGSLTIIVL